MAICKHPEEVCGNMTLYRGKTYCDNLNGFCSLHDELPLLTNADRIRAMSDEELVQFLTEEKWKCDNYRVCRECPRYVGDCCLPLDEWLKQPAEVEHE